MGEMAASLTHEISQPLSAIRTNVDAALLSMDGKPDIAELRAIFEDIASDNTRAVEIIRRIRALARKEPVEFTAIDLPAIIREIAVLVQGDALSRDIRVWLEITPGLPRAHGDKIQLQQVLLNLLLNAFAALDDCPPNRREVCVSASADDRTMLRISVTDCGKGLPVEIEVIFRQFYTTKPDGLGMGLSISRSIIEAHGGRLWAENNPDGGATFYFTLPIEQAGTLRPASTPVLSTTELTNH
jgi:two-component system sensor kinase FixL